MLNLLNHYLILTYYFFKYYFYVCLPRNNFPYIINIILNILSILIPNIYLKHNTYSYAFNYK